MRRRLGRAPRDRLPGRGGDGKEVSNQAGARLQATRPIPLGRKGPIDISPEVRRYAVSGGFAAKRAGERNGAMNGYKSWLESRWEEWLEANKDNPDPIAQYVAESTRKVLRASPEERRAMADRKIER